MATNGNEKTALNAGDSMFREEQDFKLFWEAVRERWDRDYAGEPEPSLDGWIAEAEKQLDLYRVTAQRYLETQRQGLLDLQPEELRRDHEELAVLLRLMSDAELRLGAVCFAIHTAAF